MDKGNRPNRAQSRLFGACVTCALVMLLLAACGGSSNGNTNANNTGNTNSANNNAQTSMDSNTTNGACDQMAKVIINEHVVPGKGDQYTFTPAHVTLKAGEFISFNNQTDEMHVLVATPNAGLAKSAIYSNEVQPVQFAKAGTYTLESQDAKHRATMQVTVLTAAGTTCGMSLTNISITFTEKHVQGQPVLYALTPTAISLKAGQAITLINKTTQAFDFSCKPAADLSEGNLRVGVDEQQMVQFVKTGKYTCTTTEAPRTAVTVDVQ
jgi:plastocyanin